jgi:hypothetical protein
MYCIFYKCVLCISGGNGLIRFSLLNCLTTAKSQFADKYWCIKEVDMDKVDEKTCKEHKKFWKEYSTYLVENDAFNSSHVTVSQSVWVYPMSVSWGHYYTCYTLQTCQPHQNRPRNLCQRYCSSSHGQCGALRRVTDFRGDENKGKYDLTIRPNFSKHCERM